MSHRTSVGTNTRIDISRFKRLCSFEDADTIPFLPIPGTGVPDTKLADDDLTPAVVFRPRLDDLKRRGW